MKQLLLLLFLPFMAFSQVVPPDATPLENIQITNNIQSTTATNASVQESNGVLNRIPFVNIPINVSPLNYSPPTADLQGQFKAIDTRLGQIGNTTAGITNRIYFTGDNVTVTTGTFFASNGAGKGTATSGLPTPLVNGDNQKQYFAKDLISIAQPNATTAPPGNYSGQLTVTSSPTPNGTQQRYTIEIYKTNNGGTPIASGITGASTGSLGVTVVAILDSGLINLVAGAITNISLNGNLASTLSLATGERLRYHVSAQKVGTGGGNVTMSVLYGSDYNSYYDVTVTQKASTVINDSGVIGGNVADALNTLNTGRISGTGAIGQVSFWNGTSIQSGDNNFTWDNTSKILNLSNALNFNGSSNWNIVGTSSNITHTAGVGFTFNSASLNTPYRWVLSGVEVARIHSVSGNFSLQNGGAFIDSGFRLDNSGTSRFSSNINLNFTPTTSAGSFNILTRNTSTGELEKVLSNTFPTGSGTNNFLPIWTGLNTQSNSSILNDASSIRLRKGTIIIGDDTISSNYFVSVETSMSNVANFQGSLQGVGAADISMQSSGGGLLLGTATSTGERLQVNGSLKTTSIKVIGLSGTGTRQVVADAIGNLSANDLAPTSGTYTPTFTNNANTSAFTLTNATYTRIGNVVAVSVGFSFTATLPNTGTVFDVSLPINRTVSTSITIGNGSVSNGTGASLVCYPAIVQSSATNSARVFLNPITNVSSFAGTISFQYSL